MRREVFWQNDGLTSLATPVDARPQHVDVAVLGGGLTGLSAALALAEAGLSVTVFEARTAGDGASGRNGGQVLTGVGASFRELANDLGEETARALYREGDLAVDDVAALVERWAIPCQFHRGGHIATAIAPSRLDALADDADRLGAPRTMLDASELEARLGFPGYLGGLFDPRSATVNPYALALGVGRAAVRSGVHVVEHVRARVQAGPGPFVILGADQPVRAERVLVATNAFLPATIPALKLRMHRVYGTVVATAPIDPAGLGGLLPGRPAVFEESERYTYFQLTQDGRLVFGGRALSDGTGGPEGVARFLRSLIPQASRVDVPYYWTGPLGITGMGLPFWGETGGGMVYAGGYSGHGGALSVHLGLQLGRYLATGREPAWPRIPPVPFGFSDRIARDFKRPSTHPNRFAILR